MAEIEIAYRFVGFEPNRLLITELRFLQVSHTGQENTQIVIYCSAAWIELKRLSVGDKGLLIALEICEDISFEHVGGSLRRGKRNYLLTGLHSCLVEMEVH